MLKERTAGIRARDRKTMLYLECDNARQRSVVANLQKFVYCCLYIRFIKDGSVLLILMGWVISSLCEFVQELTLRYLKKNYLQADRGDEQDDDESLAIRGLETPIVRVIINKAIRYYQGLILLETAYCIVYHIRLDVARDICSKPYGFVVMLLIREFTCPAPAGFPSKLLLLVLDFAVLFGQLLIMNGSLSSSFQNVKLIVKELDADKQGALNLLKFNTWHTDANGPELIVHRNRDEPLPQHLDTYTVDESTPLLNNTE
ncbi:Vld1p DI49_2794 [Saccharomyces eubayanus]|uniref:Vld1p n=1 Tax=Saccharomyces eubayanus TaxID=1080349 RepID=UPI0006C5EEB9|nr:hypothetical protein DI49_2794 [Saccharomyces eubayanus]KOG98902.1 hypothetical protein DI49_2794 [Saccharomyces eubayanus]